MHRPPAEPATIDWSPNLPGPARSTTSSARQVRLGVACIFGGVVALTLQDAVIKWLSSDFALHEVTFARSLVAIVITLAIVRLEGGMRLLRTRRPGLHIVRCLLFIWTNMCFFMGVASMPLAEATAVFFVAPLFITVFSVVLLKDRVGPRRWAAVLIGMVGMVIMLRPGRETLELAALFPVGAALGYALLQIITRRLGTTDRASSMALYVHLAFAVASLGVGLVIGDGRFASSDHPSLQFLLRAWSWPDGVELALLFACGVLIGAGTYFLSQAYRVAQPAVVAPFEYTALPLSLLWGLLVWGDWPDITAAVGMALIAGSGLYVFYRETLTAPPAAVRRLFRRGH